MNKSYSMPLKTHKLVNLNFSKSNTLAFEIKPLISNFALHPKNGAIMTLKDSCSNHLF